METLHATAVARGERAVLLLGPSGAGKSDLALRLVAAGWRLVADDRVQLTATAEGVMASAPPRLAGLIEVRGLGIVPEPAAPAPVALALDLSRRPERLPAEETITIAGQAIPLLPFDPFGASATERAERALASRGLAVTAASVNPPILIVSGLSGAGKSTALKALEDQGHEVVDNLPLSLFDALIAGSLERPLALGIDSRTRAFDPKALVSRIAALRDAGRAIRLLYLDCADDVLIRRFSETRRRHPLSPDRPASDGIAAERALLAPLAQSADLLLDTTELSLTDLRQRIAERFGGGFSPGLAVTLMSFGYAAGLPREADLVFDMRFLANPHWQADLRPLTGEDAAVASFVAADPLYAPTLAKLDELVRSLLPGYAREGKAYLTIAIGCTGGRHRSVAVARDLADRLAAAGQNVALLHRDIAKSTEPPGAPPAAPLTFTRQASEANGQ
ncbi:RNase adapter RapZ [Sandarakinorhabdus rubra]|uniref:RNase adapter RapZ n=1 Tax=Sandarakinorhabdus rubra TaxID=2672568 RepID=UPI0013DB898A|nr:RNase adapter RapZ [Sandarakinorhabdus rubra]